MKNLFIFLLLLLLNISNANCDLWKNIKEADKIIRFNYERNPEKGWNNLDIVYGFCRLKEEEYKFRDLDSKKNICDSIFCSKIVVNYFQFGLSLKTNDYHKFYPIFNFLLLKFFIPDNYIKFYSQNPYKEWEILNITSDILNCRNIRWINFGFHYGYDFLNRLEKHFTPSAFLKFGYNTYELDNNIFNELSKYSNLKFSNFEINAGAKLYVLLNPIAFDLTADYKKITDGPNLDIFSLNSKLFYICQERRYYFFNKKFSVNMSCNYKNYYLSGHSQNVFNVSLGIDFNFQDRDY